jgi:hypothetical protein
LKSLVDNRIKVQGGKQKVFHINMPKLCHESKGNNKITELQQSYKGKVKTHNYINRQNQSKTGKL